MSLLDRTNRLFSRQQPSGADPAHAFGSQEQIMAEFQRQEYVPPENAPRRTAEKAGGIVSALRERIARPPREYETDAPTYSADTYDQPAAPDLGWEAAFDPNARQEAPVPSAQERFEAFRNTVYSSPIPQPVQPYGFGPSYDRSDAPIYEEISFNAPPRRESVSDRPVYEEISFGPQPPRENAYQRPVYEELDFSGGRTAPDAPYPPENDPAFYGQEAYYPQEPLSGQEADPYAGQQVPAPRGEQALGSDFQYFFWSVSILTGAALTLFSFIYACVV